MSTPTESFSKFVSRIDAGIVLAGTAGLELALSGKPPIVASSPYHSGRGFTIDARSAEQNFSLLRVIPELSSLLPEQIERVWKYAYAYFFQRPFPMSAIEKQTPKSGQIRLKPNFIERVGSGGDHVLDHLCNLIVGKEEVGFWPPDALVDQTSIAPVFSGSYK